MKKVLTASWVFLLGLIANASSESMDISSFHTSSSLNISSQSGKGTATCIHPGIAFDTLESIKLQLGSTATTQEREMIRERLEEILEESESMELGE